MTSSTPFIPPGASVVGTLSYTTYAAGGCSSNTTQVSLVLWNGQYYQQGYYGPGVVGACGGGG